jgi:predicted DNA-binding WGR domain protein
MSWKMWKIERKGKVVTVYWGPMERVKHRIKPVGKLQKKQWRCSSEAVAKLQKERRIAEKRSKGYQQIPKATPR